MGANLSNRAATKYGGKANLGIWLVTSEILIGYISGIVDGHEWATAGDKDKNYCLLCRLATPVIRGRRAEMAMPV